MDRQQLMHSLPRLYVFHLIAEHGSQAAAARALGVSQPTVSEHLGRLREASGCRLVESSTGLTPRGRELHRFTSRMFAELDDLGSWFDGGQPPPLRCVCGAALDTELPTEADLQLMVDRSVRVRHYRCQRCTGGAPRFEVEFEAPSAPPEVAA